MTTPTVPQPPQKQRPVIVAVRLNDQLVRVEDLPLEVIDRIAKAHDITWLTVVAKPMIDLALARSIIDAVGEHLGVTVEPNLSVREVTAMFEAVPDDVPDPDYILDPKDDDDPDPFRGGVGN